VEKLIFRKIVSMKYYKGPTLDDIYRNNGSIPKLASLTAEVKELLRHPLPPLGELQPELEQACHRVEEELSALTEDKLYLEDHIFELVQLPSLGYGYAIPLKGAWKGASSSYQVAEDCCRPQENIDNVTIVWVAARDRGAFRVVGWHRDCTVQKSSNVVSYDGVQRHCRAFCLEQNAVMLPYQIRGLLDWEVPLVKKHGYGFGPNMSFDMDNPKTKAWVEALLEKMENYSN